MHSKYVGCPEDSGEFERPVENPGALARLGWIIGIVALAVVAALLMTACGSLDKQYVEADRATFDAVAPRYSKYLDEDKALDDTTRQERKDTITSWRVRLETAEKNK